MHLKVYLEKKKEEKESAELNLLIFVKSLEQYIVTTEVLIQ